MALIRPATGPTTRRTLLKRAGLAALGAGRRRPGGGPRAAARVRPAGAPAVITSERARPQLPYGVQTGDLLGNRAILWARADRPARMLVEWATSENFADAQKGDRAGSARGHRFYREARSRRPAGGPADRLPRQHGRPRRCRSGQRAGDQGGFRTPPAAGRPIRFLWSGRRRRPGLGHQSANGAACGSSRRCAGSTPTSSSIRATASTPTTRSPPSRRCRTAAIWQNVTTEAKAKVAETLQEFRGNYAYNLLDDNLRRFNAQVPIFAQWDDHEVANNWYPSEDFSPGSHEERVRGDQRRPARRPRRPRLPGMDAGALGPDRLAASLSQLRLRALARGLSHRHAQLPRPEHRQPAGAAGPARPRFSAARRSAG